MVMVPYDITALPLSSLKPLAEWHRSMANHLADAVKNKESYQAILDRLSARRKSKTREVDILTTYLANGNSPDQALRATAAASGLDQARLLPLLPAAIGRARQAGRLKRNREIMQRVATGWTDAEIGARFGLHPKSVNRIIKEQREKAA